MDSKETILETSQGAIKIVKFNKPRRKNAIDVNMYARVTQIFNEAAVDPDISVMVLTGTGDYYSSGNDLVAAAETHNILPVLKEFIHAFITFPKSLIAVVNGPAIGIATTTLALCDLVYASEDSFFYTPFTKLGIVAEGCSTLTFPRVMGARKAAEMLLYNHKMSAREALECGFVNDIYKPEDLQSKVWEKILELSQLPQQSIVVSKRLMKDTILPELLKANDSEMHELSKVYRTRNFVYKKKSKI